MRKRCTQVLGQAGSNHTSVINYTHFLNFDDQLGRHGLLAIPSDIGPFTSYIRGIIEKYTL